MNRIYESTSEALISDGEDAVTTAILNAASERIITDGLERTTIAGIARKAGVSRQTVYNRYGNVKDVAAVLLTREIISILEPLYPLPKRVDELVERIVTIAETVRDNKLMRSIVVTDPQILVTYQYQRLGASQKYMISFLRNVLVRIHKLDQEYEQEQKNEQYEQRLESEHRPPQSISNPYPRLRHGDPSVIATFVLMVVQSAALSSDALEPTLGSDEVWKIELTNLLKGYLYQ